MACANCGNQVRSSDSFCDNCGTPVSAVAGGNFLKQTQVDDVSATVPPVNSRHLPPPPGSAYGKFSRPAADSAHSQFKPPTFQPTASHGFFSHGPRALPDARRWTNATRYLCAAAYLAPDFTNTLIGELIASHRAVAPSRGIDLEPIIRHCIKARRMKLIRDVVLSLLLLVGLFTAPAALVFILVITFFCGYLPGAHWERRSFGSKALAGLAVAVVALFFGVFLAIALVAIVVHYLLASLAGSGAGPSLPLSGLLGTSFSGSWPAAYAVLLIGTLVRYFWLRDKTLVDWLQPGANAPGFRQEPPRVENRIAEVRRAQYGNLTFYNTEDPFIGTGSIPIELIGKGKKDDQPVWSIAIELSRAGAERGLLGFNARDRVDIDPVELHKVLRARLLQLNDPGLPSNQRVASITVDDHVVGEGRFPWDSSLIDPQRMIPYSQASLEAAEALIRAPQGRLRYYQRVSISDEGQPVLTADRRQVIGPVDRDIITSAFIYVAVEGHMFYLQFVPKALAPIDSRFREIDKLPRSTSGKFLGKVLLDALRGAFKTIITAPYNLYKALRLSYREGRNFTDEARAVADYAYADVGARLSVREFGSQGNLETYIQALDTDKYTQIVERLVLETVLDFLVAKGADTTAYRASAASIVNSTIISGNTGDWNANLGAGNQAVVRPGVEGKANA